jgi:WD40 repeat protein
MLLQLSVDILTLWKMSRGTNIIRIYSRLVVSVLCSLFIGLLLSNPVLLGDDKLVLVWDHRAKEKNRSSHRIEGHKAEVNSVAFNPFNEFLLATGSADKTGLFVV